METIRLSREAWTDTGLRALAANGFTALKADVLARTLGVSRGSFYWHFNDVRVFHMAVLDRWRELALDGVVAEIDQRTDDRLLALLKRAFGTRSKVEIAVRSWAAADADVQRAVDDLDLERVRYLEELILAAGAPKQVAHARAQLLNWAYVGHLLSGHLVSGGDALQVIEDLSFVARKSEPL